MQSVIIGIWDVQERFHGHGIFYFVILSFLLADDLDVQEDPIVEPP